MALQWKWIFSFTFCSPEAGSMHSNEMCKRPDWFARIPDWAIWSRDERLPVIMVKVACPAVCAHAVTSSALYSWISKALVCDLQVVIGSNSNIYHLQYFACNCRFFLLFCFFSPSLAKNGVAFEYELQTVVSLYLPLTAIGQPQNTRNYTSCRIITSFTRRHITAAVGKVCSAGLKLCTVSSKVVCLGVREDCFFLWTCMLCILRASMISYYYDCCWK